MDKESSGRRWESGALAHGVSDPFGQGPLPWLRSPDHYFESTEDAIPWYPLLAGFATSSIYLSSSRMATD